MSMSLILFLNMFLIMILSVTVLQKMTSQLLMVNLLFSWDSNIDNIVDKYGQQSAPLKDLDGKVIIILVGMILLLRN